MRQVLIGIVAVLALAACGGADGGSPPGEPGTGAGAPANGGLSVADAKASDLDGPLMVHGFIVADDQRVLLCEELLESLPPQCGGEWLVVEGIDLDSYETSSEGGARWTDAPVSVLGEVDGETLRVSDTAA